MLQTIKDITDSLVKHYDPEKIILFGSYGKKGFKKSSDIDVLVIKDTEKRPLERHMEAEKILADRNVPIDIMVYTPDEVNYLFSIGSPFMEDIMEKGRLLYMRKATESWIKEAQEELDSATILYEHEKYRSACYHAQQCVEKGLKAVIIEEGKKPERTHDIVELLNRVKKLGFEPGLTMDQAVFLNSIYKGRYPAEQGLLPRGEPSRQDTEIAIAATKMLMARTMVL